ncbi:Pre-rRNA-processing protein TSR2-domain-containing protein, partial [Cytidiella melzeri]
ALPPPVSILFARGVIARLATWSALRMAVDQGWGGPDSAAKRTWLASVIVDAFEEEDPEPDVGYVELTLLQVMEDEFETVLEDGSAEPVAQDIVRLWEQVQSGSDIRVREFEGQAERTMGTTVPAQEVVGDESEWEEASGEESDGEDSDDAPMLVEPGTKPEAEVDEDGFTLV